MDRFHLVHVLSREAAAMPMFSGRLDPARLGMLLDAVVPSLQTDRWFLCGPFELVAGARRLLASRGVRPDQISDELFFAGPLDLSTLPAEPLDEPGTVNLTFTLQGRTSTTRMLPETAVLDAALRVRRELPFSCKGGMCASCKARLIEGQVRMNKNWALIESELRSGYILTCQSHPLSDRLVVDYDV
jgi:ring-1,2-phenylacetyl-CoA epoxidase subunit PaaE